MSGGYKAFGAPAIVALAIFVGAVAARAEDCHPLTMVTSVDLVPTSDNTWQFVPVSINNSSRLMLLDTGAFFSLITPQAVEEFELPHRTLDFNAVDVAGEKSRLAATVHPFALGRLVAQSMDFVIMTNERLFGDDKRRVGVIGSNILREYDVDIDFGTHKLNFMSPDHCEGRVIYWQAAAVAVVPMQVLPSGHIVVPVKLDGQDVLAILDTGASNSTLTNTVAEGDFKLKLGSTDTPYVRDLQDKQGAAVYRHRFSSLDFGGIAASNPEFAIIPNFLDHPLELSPSLGTRFVDPEARAEAAPMLLGMNILRHLHLYIAYKEKKLYITPAGIPQNSADAQTPH